MNNKLQLKIVIGSTRPGRAADVVFPWVMERATAHDAFDVELVDLRAAALPMFQETVDTVGNFRDPTFSDPSVKAWNRTVASADAVVIVTPEYNHSIPAVLKNALDSIFLTFALRHKPVGFVGYSSSGIGAARAVEHLVQIISDAEAVPLRNTVLISSVESAMPDGRPVSRATDVAMQIMLDDLAWWSAPLKRARADGQLPPGPYRFRKAMASA